MKIHRVTLTGFGPYRGTETVDFDQFEDAGIFLIGGRTGAGKSSILDAVTYALFGRIPRYDEAAGDKVRSDFCAPGDPCRVQVEFSTPDGRYRVARSPEYLRPKKHGTGLTRERAQFQLARLADGEWQVIEAKVGNAERSIDEIVHLNAKQFQQVILLAQGQFQEFLVAGSDKRRDLLRQLFGSARFSDYSARLDEQARTLRQRLLSSLSEITANTESLADQVGEAVPGDLDTETGAGVAEWIEEVAGKQEQARDAALSAAAAVQQELEEARAALDQARAVAERQRRRAAAVARQSQLRDGAAAVEADRLALSRARRAALAWPAVSGHRQAATRHRAAEQDRTAAERAFGAALPEESPDPGSLARLLQQHSELLGTLRQAELQEMTLRELQAAHQAALAELEACDARLRAGREARAAHQTEAEALTRTLATLAPQVEQLPQAEALLAELTRRHQAARSAEETQASLAAALERRQVASRTALELGRRRDALYARQLEEYAGVLAAELGEHDPCLVCGSTEHPAKAAAPGAPVDAEALELARQACQEAERALAEHSDEATRLQTLAATQLEAAGGASVADLAEDLSGAQQRCAELAAAKEQHAEAVVARERVVAAVDRLGAELEAEQERRSELVAAEARTRESYEATIESLRSARGAHPTVAARAAEIAGRIKAIKLLRDATAAWETTTAALAETAEAVAAAVHEHGFADAEEVDTARLSPAEQDALERRILEHEAATRAVAEALAADELQELPEEPVDLAPLETACREAEAAHRRAAHTLGSAERLHSTVTGLVRRIRADLATAAGLRQRYQVVDRLAATVRGQPPNTMKMMLETFALAAELEEIVAMANARLRVMTGGRYEFLHSDALAGRGAQSGLALQVLDAHTGETRTPQSLSGGEKFQASLALALGLAEVVTSRAGGIRLDTLFIDEGFGSLDPDTLEATMATLDNLREGGRTIGLISHVDAMKETIPAQLFVEVTPGGWSTITQSWSGAEQIA